MMRGVHQTQRRVMICSGYELWTSFFLRQAANYLMKMMGEESMEREESFRFKKNCHSAQ